MKKFKLFIIVFLILNFAYSFKSSKAQWVQMSNGIGTNQTVYCFSMNGTNLFIGTESGGIFLSTNYGTSWSVINNGLTNLNVKALTVSGTRIFAGTVSGGVFLSTNNGTNWTAVNNGLPAANNISSLSVCGTNIFAGTYYNGVFRSTNNGVNWTAVNNGITHTYIRSLGVSGTNIFAGSEDGGVFLSTNNGTNWSAMNNGLTNSFIKGFAFSGTKVYAGTFGGGVFESTNNGANWIAINNGLTNNYILSLAVFGTNIFAGTLQNLYYSGGIYLTTNNGLNWYTKNHGFSSLSSINSLFSVNNYMFAGTMQSVWRLDLTTPSISPSLLSPANNSIENPLNLNLKWSKSQYAIVYNTVLATDASFTNIIIDSVLTDTLLALTNLNIVTNYYWKVRTKYISEWGQYSSPFTFRTGSPWVPKYNGMGNNKNVNSLVSNGMNIFAGVNDSGVYFSTNNGGNWSAANNGLTNLDVSSLVISGTNLFAGTEGGGVFHSTNNGGFWIAVSSGLTSLNVSSLLSYENYIFAGTSIGVFRTSNNGGSWTAVNNGLPMLAVKSLFLKGTYLYAGTYSGGVYISTNSGGLWNPINYGLTNLFINSFSSSGIYLFVGTDAGIFRSTNDGITWSLGWLTNQAIYAITVSGNKLFAGTGNGIFLSFDYGESWSPLNQGFNTVPNVKSFLIKNDYIFAGTNQSVWSRNLTYIIGIKIIPEIVPTSHSLFQNYPNPFNPETKIQFKVASSKFIKLAVFDILGKEVATLVSEKLQPGTYEVTFDGSEYPSGVYFYRLTTEDFSETKRMILIK